MMFTQACSVSAQRSRTCRKNTVYPTRTRSPSVAPKTGKHPRAYEQLTKWGRWQVVSERQSADLILLLSAHQYNGGYIGNTTGTVDENGNINATSSSTPVTVGYTFITIVDPKTGDNLWSDSKRWGNLYTGFHSATKGLVDELMKRINEEEPKK